MIRKGGLTDRQKDVLQHIIAFVHQNHRSPLIRELADRLDLASPTVSKHLEKLEEKGYIESESGKGIRILSTPPSSEYVLVRKEVLEQALEVLYGNVTDQNSKDIVIDNLESKLKEVL